MKNKMKIKDLVFIGFGIVVCTSIFTLPGQVAAQYCGPSVILAIAVAAIVSICIALIYAEFSSVLPSQGSVYIWVKKVFGDFAGWIVGILLLLEYVICLGFIASGFSANITPLLSQIGIHIPFSLTHSLSIKGGLIDLVAIVIIVITCLIALSSVDNFKIVDNLLVVSKMIAILVFVGLGLTKLHLTNFHPFIPSRVGSFGGVEGIVEAIPIVFIAFLGFDAIASEVNNVEKPSKSMPIAIIISISLSALFFILVSVVLIGITPYKNYANNIEPIAYSLRLINHPIIADVIQIVAVVGMITALLGLVSSIANIVFALIKDGVLSKKLMYKNKNDQPVYVIVLIGIIASVLGGVVSFDVLSKLIASLALIVFMFVIAALIKYRKEEGKNYPKSAFKIKLFPLISIVSFVLCLLMFINLGWSTIYSTIIVVVLVALSYSFIAIKKRHV